MRTHILICLGCALFTVVSTEGFLGAEFDPSRVAAGVVAGMGFLGAGVVIRGQQGIVASLTTAASIWAMGPLGSPPVRDFTSSQQLPPQLPQ